MFAGRLLILALALPALATAQYDRLSEGQSPTWFALDAGVLRLAIKGELELELHDLEGDGGPGHDSPTDTRTIGTRSPFVELDMFLLGLRLSIGELVQVNTELEFTLSSARLAGSWMTLDATGPDWLRHHVSLGYHTPIVAIDRRTERYPLIATSYWREAEIHLAYQATFQVAEATTLQLGASVAMMRPLAFAGVQESTSHAGTINILGYAPARTFSGNGVMAGGRAQLRVHGAFLDVFGFTGALAAEAGTDALRSGFPHYRDLPAGDGRAWWAGGRVGYEGYGVLALAEAIVSQEDALTRFGVYGQASWRIGLLDGGWLPSVEPLVRYEIYRLVDAAEVQASGRALRSPASINAVSWNFDVVTLAAIVEVYRDLLRLRVEYAWVFEENGVPALGVPDEPFRNHELLVQVELRF